MKPAGTRGPGRPLEIGKSKSTQPTKPTQSISRYITHGPGNSSRDDRPDPADSEDMVPRNTNSDEIESAPKPRGRLESTTFQKSKASTVSRVVKSRARDKFTKSLPSWQSPNEQDGNEDEESEDDDDVVSEDLDDANFSVQLALARGATSEVSKKKEAKKKKFVAVEDDTDGSDNEDFEVQGQEVVRASCRNLDIDSDAEIDDETWLANDQAIGRYPDGAIPTLSKGISNDFRAWDRTLAAWGLSPYQAIPFYYKLKWTVNLFESLSKLSLTPIFKNNHRLFRMALKYSMAIENGKTPKSPEVGFPHGAKADAKRLRAGKMEIEDFLKKYTLSIPPSFYNDFFSREYWPHEKLSRHMKKKNMENSRDPLLLEKSVFDRLEAAYDRYAAAKDYAQLDVLWERGKAIQPNRPGVSKIDKSAKARAHILRTERHLRMRFQLLQSHLNTHEISEYEHNSDYSITDSENEEDEEDEEDIFRSPSLAQAGNECALSGTRDGSTNRGRVLVRRREPSPELTVAKKSKLTADNKASRIENKFLKSQDETVVAENEFFKVGNQRKDVVIQERNKKVSALEKFVGAQQIDIHSWQLFYTQIDGESNEEMKAKLTRIMDQVKYFTKQYICHSMSFWERRCPEGFIPTEASLERLEGYMYIIGNCPRCNKPLGDTHQTCVCFCGKDASYHTDGQACPRKCPCDDQAYHTLQGHIGICDHNHMERMDNSDRAYAQHPHAWCDLCHLCGSKHLPDVLHISCPLNKEGWLQCICGRTGHFFGDNCPHSCIVCGASGCLRHCFFCGRVTADNTHSTDICGRARDVSGDPATDADGKKLFYCTDICYGTYALGGACKCRDGAGNKLPHRGIEASAWNPATPPSEKAPEIPMEDLDI